MPTYQEILQVHDVAVPPHLEAQADVPVIHSPWRQGDIVMSAEFDLEPKGEGVKALGVKIVKGEADRNSHILDCSDPNARWHRGVYRDSVLDYGIVYVPAGAVAYISHTDEHGSVGIAGGDGGRNWLIWGQMSYGPEIRRASD